VERSGGERREREVEIILRLGLLHTLDFVYIRKKARYLVDSSAMSKCKALIFKVCKGEGGRGGWFDAYRLKRIYYFPEGF
jgi:hypothetical protein